MLSMMMRVRMRVFAMVVMAWFLTMGIAHAQTANHKIVPILMLLLEDECSQTETKTVTPTAGSNGSISPSTPQTVFTGCTTTFTVTPDANYGIDTVSGCSGYLNGNTYATGRITEDCTVTAAFLPAYSVTASAGPGGTINPTSASVTQGKTTSFTVTPNTGYAIDSVGGTCGGTLTGSTYTTLPITMACTVTASFTPTFTVTATADTGGTIDPTSAEVIQNQTKQFTVTANSGYVVSSVSGCGGIPVTPNTAGPIAYTTGSIIAACTVTASFKPTFTVTATAGTGGTIDPTSAVVIQDQTKQFTVTANSGYAIKSVTGCGVGTLVGINETTATYTTAPVTAACTVSATFQAAHTVTALVTGSVGGLVTPPSQVVASGTSARVTLLPYTGYVIDSVGGTCGGTLSNNTYTISAVTANCTLTASFILQIEAPTYQITTNAGANGSIQPLGMTVSKYTTWSFTVTPDTGYVIDNVTGCSGVLNEAINEYTTAPITAACTVTASFKLANSTPSYTVTATAGSNGTISPSSRTVTQGQTTTFDVTPATGYTASMSGTCGGTLSGTGTTKTYTTNAITANCTVIASFSINQSPATDPGYGSGLWIPPAYVASPINNSTLVVADHSGSPPHSAKSYVPGCLNGATADVGSGCALSTSYTGIPVGLSQAYTFTFDPSKTLSVRFKPNTGAGTTTKQISLKSDDGSSGLTGVVEMWITTDPTVSYANASTLCKKTASSSLTITTGPGACPLSAAVPVYYVNLRQTVSGTPAAFQLYTLLDDFQ